VRFKLSNLQLGLGVLSSWHKRVMLTGHWAVNPLAVASIHFDDYKILSPALKVMA